MGAHAASRALAIAGMSALVLGLAVVLAGSLRSEADAAPGTGAPLRVVSRLPAWLAPGARFAVEGWTSRGARVVLVARGRRVLAVGRSGQLGHFRLRAVAPPPGRYRIAVQARGGETIVGVLAVRPLRLAAVGDVTFGSSVADAIAAAGPRYPWLSVARLLRSADVSTANLEGAVSTRGWPVPGKEYTFRGTPAALETAARLAGIDVVSLANNHTLDFGLDAFFDTVRAARRYGIATVGGGADLWRARQPATIEAGGLRIAFLGYSDVRPLGFTAADGVPGTAPAYPELIDADVRRARRRADVVAVWFHWGIERDTRPSAQQQALAAVALRAGAQVVLGAHPHVLQPIGRPAPRSVVAWSLGNFVFPAHSPLTEETGVLLLDLDARGVRRVHLRRATIAGVQPRLHR